MIPRVIYWLADLLILAVAFLAAYSATPIISTWIGAEGPWRAEWLVKTFAIASASGSLSPLNEIFWVYVVMGAAVIPVLSLLNAHAPLLSHSRTRLLLSTLAAVTAGLSLVALVLFALKSHEWSRILIFSFGVFSAIGLASYRLILRQYFRLRQKAGYYTKNLLVIGSRPIIDRIAMHFQGKVSDAEYHLYGCLIPGGEKRDHPSDASVATKEGAGIIPCLGVAEDLGQLLIHRPITEVIAVQPQTGGGWLAGVIKDCDYFRAPLWIIPEVVMTSECHDLHAVGSQLALPAFILRPREFNSDELFLKRLLDFSVSGLLLVLLSPLFLAVALAIKITSPSLPVFYPWRVVGFRGKEFTGYKFTTMAADADQRREYLLKNNEMSGPVFKIKNDPRVTPLGQFLRKYSLNELPQLWSVLMGEMSLVGPRPAFPHELARYELWHKRKLSVRPGITCLWQVRGRNKISNFDDWVRMDLEYISNWSLWLDIKILFRTACVVVRGTGS